MRRAEIEIFEEHSCMQGMRFVSNMEFSRSNVLSYQRSNNFACCKKIRYQVIKRQMNNDVIYITKMNHLFAILMPILIWSFKCLKK